jgi:NAD(P)H-dependent flavin oxidoreductase YrpB (nitropropane dioxygenase family)
MRRKGLNLPAAFFNAQDIAKNLHLPFIKLFIGVLLSGWKTAKQLAYLANASKAFQLATEEGDLVKGVLPVGQCTGLLKDEPTVKELFTRMVSEAEAIEKRMAGVFA